MVKHRRRRNRAESEKRCWVRPPRKKDFTGPLQETHVYQDEPAVMEAFDKSYSLFRVILDILLRRSPERETFRAAVILIARAHGVHLHRLGKHFRITRERVRQIEIRTQNIVRSVTSDPRYSDLFAALVDRFTSLEGDQYVDDRLQWTDYTLPVEELHALDMADTEDARHLRRLERYHKTLTPEGAWKNEIRKLEKGIANGT